MFLDVQPGSILPLLLFLAVTGALVVAGCRRGRLAGASIAALAFVQLVAGVVAASRIEPPVLPYLVVWMLPFSMFIWVATAWGAWDVFLHDLMRSAMNRWSRPRHAAAVGLGLVLAVTLIAVPIMRTGNAWLAVPPPRQDQAGAVRSVASQLDRVLPNDARLRVETTGDAFAQAGPGVIAALARSGRQVFTSDGGGGLKWGTTRTWDDQAVESTILIVVEPVRTDTGMIAACDGDPDMTRIASFDPLSEQEVTELESLAIVRYLHQGALDDANRVRIAELEPRSLRVAVYEGGDTCGS